MGLRLYRKKRDFRRTAEPRGRPVSKRKTGKALSYFIQRHAASRLHYDFRLELGGTLKSWAVPKGPSFDPADRRLAVHVEDHPMEYGAFEGEIPEGQYGGGTVLLWDLGRWTPLGDPAEDYAKGRLKFRLEGAKLRGNWTLVRMTGPRSEGGKNWLLIKERDEHARAAAAFDVTKERPESVKDRAHQPSAGTAVLAPGALPGAEKQRVPEFVAPQLAALAAAVPRDEGWIHEIKYDGYRIQAIVEDGRVRLVSRNGNDWTSRFAAQSQALKHLAAKSAVIDGEMVVLDAEGRSHFQELQNALCAEKSGHAVYCVFDVLHLDGWDLRRVPLTERKALLSRLLESSGGVGSRVRYTEHIEGDGAAFKARACELGLEGIICKRGDGTYRSGRAPEWLKVKCLLEQEFVIAGFTDPGGSRSKFGALVLGLREGKALRYVGRVGTGFNAESLREIHRKLAPLETEESPLSARLSGPEAKGVRFVRPELVCEVAFRGWTREGVLRQASFKGLREDKPASEVVLEKPQVPAKAKAAARISGDVVEGVKITNPDRVIYPESGLTKKDIAIYYAETAELVLGEISQRPLAILRCPRGREKHCFFQKHEAEGFPESIRSFPILEKDGGTERYLYVDDAKGLISLIQFGALELHPWGCRIDDIEHPDRLIFDLDPAPDVGWKDVVSAAREVKTGLEALGLVAFLKTTGGKGLHVVTPLDRSAKWPEAKAFARDFAAGMAAAVPGRYTAKLAKAARGGKIFVDYLRNERGSTAVAAYSTRARPGAPVSTPISWDELTPALKSDRWTVVNVRRRLARRGGPWDGFEASRRALPRF